jgi:outer membrane receptor protein involved in Fe transport
LPGAFYLDANINYKFDIGKAHSELFFSAKNLLNRSPPPESGSVFYNANTGNTLYDMFGAVYRAGIRVQM